MLPCPITASSHVRPSVTPSTTSDPIEFPTTAGLRPIDMAWNMLNFLLHQYH